MRTLSILLCVIFIVELIEAERNLRLVQEWKTIDYKFPDETSRNIALQNGEFIPGMSFIIDTDVQYRNGGKTRVFVTTPRFADGRPVTLGVINRQLGTPNALIAPYPDYSWHVNQRSNCDGMTSILRIAIDRCSRLWAIDSGRIDNDQVCPAQLLAFDLNTDTLILRHRFTDAYRNGSLLVTPIVDVRDAQCDDTFVYIADVSSFAIIVFDLATSTSWRVRDKFTYPHPRYGTYTILGESFTIMDGVFALALSPFKSRYEDRTLYFHALASNTENIIKTSAVRNRTLWSDDDYHTEQFQELPGRRSSQAATEAIDKDGIMYFGLINQNAIACWNTATPYSQENIHILVQDDETLQFASGVKIIDNLKGGQELWIATCRLQKVWTGTINNEEVNYRILAANVKDLIRGSKCVYPKAEGNVNTSNTISGIFSQTHGGANYQGR